jgi:tetratricopeptide (TPR) repeat protein
MSLNKSRLTVVVGLMLAIGGAVLWAADATDSSSAPPAQASADQTAEARKHLAVAHDLFSQHKYQQAEEENNTALELDPNLADAHLMKQLIEPNLSGDTASGSATPTDAQGRTFLTKAEINCVKLAEITPDDLATVRGSIPRKDLEDFWNDVVLKDPTQTNTTAEDRAAFFNTANFGNQIQLIQTEQANKYLDKINIINDPIAVLDYKRTIQPFVLQNCATSRCHGGKENNGGFFYPHGGPDVNTAFYTAYYVINTLSFNG